MFILLLSCALIPPPLPAVLSLKVVSTDVHPAVGPHIDSTIILYSKVTTETVAASENEVTTFYENTSITFGTPKITPSILAPLTVV